MAAPIPSSFDGNQVLQHAFDQNQGRLRVDASLSPFGGATEVAISHEDDSIRLGDGVNLVTTTTSGSDVALDVNVVNSVVASTPNISVVSLPSSGTEYSFAIPVGAKQIEFKSRQRGLLKYAFITGDIGSGTYITVSPGAIKDITNFNTLSSLTLFVTSTKNGDTLEVQYWS